MEKQAPQEPVYLVDESIESLSKWPHMRRGYTKLVLYFAFVVLYLVIITMQLKIGDSWAISAGLQEQFLGNLGNVVTQDDFWNFILGTSGTGLMNIVFQNEWYNGQAFSTAEQGFVLTYDKLVGGVLIVQQRGDVVKDGCVSQFGSTSYDKFYTDCYLDTYITSPYPTTTLTTDPDLTGMTPYPFTYDANTYGGYAAFFGVAAGSDRNLMLVQKLQNALWTDKQTRLIEVKFAVFNGNYNAFSFVKFDFYFDKSGIFTNGNHMESQSIQMEPYRSSYDSVRLFLEIVFMLCLAHLVWEFIFAIAIKVRARDWLGLIDLWTLIDFGNIGCLSLFVGLRVLALWLIYNNPITVPTNEYQPILENVSNIQDVQRLVIFITVILSLIRMHKFYQFQGRLAVLNRTFGHAFTDLGHFLVMFAVIFGGFAVMAHFLFGLSVADYSSVGNSMQTLWQMLLGGFNYPELDYASPAMAAVFFVSFMFVVNIVLINVLLAILINAYAMAVDDSTSATSVAADFQSAVYKNFHAMRRSAVNDQSILTLLQQAQSKGVKELSGSVMSSHFGGDRAAVGYPGLVQHKEDEEKTEAETVVNALREVLRENNILRQRLREAGEDVPEVVAMY